MEKKIQQMFGYFVVEEGYCPGDQGRNIAAFSLPMDAHKFMVENQHNKYSLFCVGNVGEGDEYIEF